MITLGQTLKQARESRGITLNEVADITKISIRILRAIEDGDESALPPKTFLRGFIYSYASYLKLDTEQILAQFQSEMGSTRPEEPISEITPQSSSPANVEPTTKLRSVAAAALVAAIIAAIFLVKKTVDKYEKESIVVDSKPVLSADITATAPANSTPSPSFDLSPQISAEIQLPGQEPSPSPSPSQSPSPSPSPSTSTSPSPSPAFPLSPSPAPSSQAAPPVVPNLPSTQTPKISLIPTPVVTKTKEDAQPLVIPTPQSAPQATPTETRSPSPSPSPATTVDAATVELRSQELIVEALDGIQLEFSVDGAAAQQVALKAEQIFTIKGRKSIQIKISNGGAINLIHNGKDRGVPGDLGKALEVKFP